MLQCKPGAPESVTHKEQNRRLAFSASRDWKTNLSIVRVPTPAGMFCLIKSLRETEDYLITSNCSLSSYLPVCQLDPLAAKALQIPAGGFYMSRLINVTCFRGEREEDVWCSRASLWMLMNLSRGRTHVRVQWKWHGVYCFALRSL